MTNTINKEAGQVQQEILEAIINDESRLHPTFDYPIAAHQGDLTFVALKGLPESAKLRDNRQLAEGNTQGSRHILTRGYVYDCDPEEVSKAIKALYKVEVEAEYIGPVFMSPDAPTADDLTHPEHGNHGFPAKTICAVVYQRNLDVKRRAARVRD